MNKLYEQAHDILMREAPHVEVLDDVYIDLYRERDASKYKWMTNIAELLVDYPDKAQEIIKNLLADRFFKVAFEYDYRKLDTKHQSELKSMLPPELMRGMGL